MSGRGEASHLERRLLELARRECANYYRHGFGQDGCLLAPGPDGPCQLAAGAGAQCRYFREAVLPLAAAAAPRTKSRRKARDGPCAQPAGAKGGAE